MVAPFAWCVECLAGHPVSPLGSTFARVGRYLRLRDVWDVCVCHLEDDKAPLDPVIQTVAPPLKTLAVAVWGVVVIAYQAGAGSAGLTGAWGELIAVVFGALSSAGVIAFLRKWWERRQLREEQAQDAIQNDIEKEQALTKEQEALQRRNEAIKQLRDVQVSLAAKTLERKKIAAKIKYEGESASEATLNELQGVDSDIELLNKTFEQIAIGGIDLSAFGVKEKQFDWREELVLIVKPLIENLKGLTEKPRKIEGLKRIITDKTLSRETTIEALTSIEGLLETSKDTNVNKKLKSEKQEWLSRAEELEREVQLAQYQLINTWHMQQYAYMLGKMKAIDEGGSSLLKNSMVLCGSPLRDGNKHDGGQPEADDDFLLGPACLVVVVVDRRALEDALAPAQLERADLQDHRQHFPEEYAADDDEQELLPCDDREVAECSAQGERARVAHEHLRGVTVEPQEPQAGPGHRPR